MHAPRLRALVTALLVLVVWAPAPPAAAHGELVSSDPSDGGLAEALPSRAILTFSMQVATIEEITVVGPDGSVTNGDPTAAGIEVRQNLWAGPDGPYTLAYHVVSPDGHEVLGEVQFEIGSPAAATDQASTDAAAEEMSAVGDGLGGDGLRATVPVAVVLLAGCVALLVLHRRRRSTP